MCNKLVRQTIWLSLLLAAHGSAAGPAWKSKPASDWTEEDARQVLAGSPWVRQIKATITRRLSEDELRVDGQMGQPQGVGYDGVDPKGSGPKVSPNIFSGPGGNDRGTRALARPIALILRWESALPVRLAELKSHELDLPTLRGDGYRLAVYGLPNANVKGDPSKLGEPLKKTAVLKREGKKDVKSVSAEVFPSADGLVVVYLFPASAEITRKDARVEFDAQIGRIVVTQTFDLTAMEFMGKLEL